MTPSRRRPFQLPALAVVCTLFALTGCGGGTTTAARAHVEPPLDPPAEIVEICAALHKQLPRSIAGKEQRDPEPVSDLTAGWGDPAIVLRCGVTRPEKMGDPNADAVAVNGVEWLVERQPAGTHRFTSTYREAYVEVTLPRGSTDAGALTYLAEAVKKTVPSSL
ncbi:DUF3515 domain-containing protein [Streptomyces sp. NPDC006879]|uniref:DUF3515 domain-containing protein n=1 Tax=Streptomyces sp. NPDC006879 TaxID=3364767 RepID=UPI00368B5C9A